LKNLLAINFTKVVSNESRIKLLLKIKLLSSTGFISAFALKGKAEKCKQTLLSLFDKISTKEELEKFHQRGNETSLSKCCQSCRNDFWLIKMTENKEALCRFLSCFNSDCLTLQ